MKATEWAEKFLTVPDSEAPVEEKFAEVLKEFGVETAELVAARTKTSKPETRLGAAEGAVREQKSKFRAVCGRVPALTEALFDSLLTTAVPDYIAWKAAAEKKKAEKDNKPDDDVKNYRNRKGRQHHHKPKENAHASQQRRQDKVGS